MIIYKVDIIGLFIGVLSGRQRGVITLDNLSNNE